MYSQNTIIIYKIETLTLNLINQVLLIFLFLTLMIQHHLLFLVVQNHDSHSMYIDCVQKKNTEKTKTIKERKRRTKTIKNM